ncbi:MAG: 30S ribosomal protein S3 [Coxiellaceae bacterium]|nr:30S ribosomal protein S3 [Coxiellaceae bacterium]|tara:strand:- start:6020 stop:6724 length:705 start_codon:yes stop_codon:yes gene_type:complete
MGQKVNPNGIRLGINKDWTSKWFAKSKDFASYLNADLKIRKYLRQKLKGASISKIKIERPARNAKVAIYSARPGVIIGKKGGDVEVLRSKLQKMIDVPVHLTIEEIRKPELDAHLVAANIAQQLERRVMFRRAMKRAVQTTMRQGALGIKISCGGRLGGAEIARSEWVKEGRVPLHTFRADIDYGVARAKTTYGIIGVKVWIFKGEVQPKKEKQDTIQLAATSEEAAAGEEEDK